MRTRSSYAIICILRNLVIGGGDGQRVVHDAFTDELRQVLPKIGSMVKQWRGGVTASQLQEFIREIWPEAVSVSIDE